MLDSGDISHGFRALGDAMPNPENKRVFFSAAQHKPDPIPFFKWYESSTRFHTKAVQRKLNTSLRKGTEVKKKQAKIMRSDFGIARFFGGITLDQFLSHQKCSSPTSKCKTSKLHHLMQVLSSPAN